RFSRDWSSDVCSSDLEVHYDVAGAFAALNMSGSAETAELSLLHPLERSRGHNRMLNLGLRHTVIKQSVLGVENQPIKLPLLSFEIGRASWREKGERVE